MTANHGVFTDGRQDGIVGFHVEKDRLSVLTATKRRSLSTGRASTSGMAFISLGEVSLPARSDLACPSPGDVAITRFNRATLVWAAGLGSSVVGLAAPAMAQSVAQPTNPGLQQQQEIQQQRQQDQPTLLRKDEPPLITPADQAPPTDKPQEDPEVLIQRVEVQGARVISPDRIRAAFAPVISTGPQPRPVRFSQVQAALAAASNLYRQAGYFTSRVIIPRGGLKDGVLTVVAVEGYLEEVEVTGRGSDAFKRWARDYLQRLVSTAADPKPLRFHQLERQLLLMQGFGGVRFKTTLAQGANFASSKLVVELNPQTFSGTVAVDNNVQQQLGEVQVSAQVQLNVLNAAPQPLQFDVFANNAFPYAGGLNTGLVSFTTPLGTQGLRLVGAGSYTRTKSVDTPLAVGGAPLLFNTAGESWFGTLALRYPLWLSRTSAVSVSLSGELQNATNNAYINGLLAYSNPTRLRVLRLGLDGSRSSPYSATSASLQISQGLPIANAFDQVTSAQTRGSLPDGSVTYTSARLSLRHQQRIGATNTLITLSGSGQLTNTMVPAPEDFAYGGQSSGRAYRGVYLTGDQGASAGIELSHAINRGGWTFTPYVFADFGVAANSSGFPTPPNYYATSYGIGARANWSSTTSWDVGWAIPGGAYPEATRSSGVEHSIVYFRASLSF